MTAVFINSFILFFVAIDTIGNIPFFLSLTEEAKIKNIYDRFISFYFLIKTNIQLTSSYNSIKILGIHLPKKYSKSPVKAVVVPIPFTQSFNANTRESEVLAVLNK